MKKSLFTLFAVLCIGFMSAQQANQLQSINMQTNCHTIPVDIAIYETNLIPPLPVIVITDADSDGISDDVEGTGDLDGDGVANYLDLDSDGDGVADSIDLCYYQSGLPPSGCPEAITERNVFWVHGYQGNSESLAMAGEDAAERYKINSRYPDYNATQTSLSACADELRSDINSVLNGAVNTDKNFIIAHSMGGLVTRVLGEVPNPAGGPAYNGVITFGTPHLGAAIARTLTGSEAKINLFLSKTCKGLAAGPASEAINNTGAMGRLAVTFGLAGGVLKEACDAGVGYGFPLVRKFLETGLEGQLTPEAASVLPPVPTGNKAAFFGVEDDDDETLTPRFIGAALHSANDFPLYGADEADGLGLTLVNNELNFYNSRYNHWDNQNAPWWLWLTCPTCAVAEEIRYHQLAKSWKKGVDWFQTLNPTWKELIGAMESTVVQTGCQCDTYSNGNLDYSQTYFGVTDCESYESGGYAGWTECNPYYEVTYQNKPSDAFILQESAMNMPGANYEPIEMVGSNHLQMRNDSEMGKAIDAIFLYGLNKEYFKTATR